MDIQSRKPGALLLLAAALLLALCALAPAARALEVEQTGSITFRLTGEGHDALKQDGVSFEGQLYRIATVDQDYTYTAIGDFAQLDLADFKAFDTQQVQALRDQAAAAIGPDTQPQATLTFVNGQATANDLPTGLYLLCIPYQDQGETRTTFEPVLVPLPALQDGQDQYELEVSLKAEESEALTDLYITKDLRDYSTLQGTATFVFEVTVEKDGVVYYHNVLALNFDAAGQQTLHLDGLPVGATVTVTEVYTGASYQLVTDGSGTQVIQALAPKGEDTENRVTFENTYSGSPNSGSAVVNAFDPAQSGQEGFLRQLYSDKAA